MKPDGSTSRTGPREPRLLADVGQVQVPVLAKLWAAASERDRVLIAVYLGFAYAGYFIMKACTPSMNNRTWSSS